MKIMRLALTAVFWLGLLAALPAATNWYVATNLLGDGSSWALATNSLQGMIDDSRVLAGDTVWVSNGVYQTGGVTNWPAGTVLTNRVAINKAITVQAFSTNPVDTVIKGAWDPATNGPAAVRCVYMVNNSALIGFTLTNGATFATGVDDRYGGAVWCQSTIPIISNCVLTGNSAYWVAGGSFYGRLFNCTLSGNSSVNYAGGAYAGTLTNCTLSGNSAGGESGGARDSTLYNCLLTGNSAGGNGGGATGGTLYNCTLVGNSGNNGGGVSATTLYNCTLSSNSAVGVGGGANNSTLTNCTLSGNSVGSYGGGAYDCTLYNCLLTGNSADYGGGAFYGTLFNCTVVGNYAGTSDGGTRASTLVNDIVYFNDAPSGSNWVYPASFTNTCTVPAPTNGVGNITDNPALIDPGSGYGTNHVAGNYRLQGASPCLNAGTNFSWMTDPNDVRSEDLDGLPRIRYVIVDMGAYETLLKGTVFYIH